MGAKLTRRRSALHVPMAASMTLVIGMIMSIALFVGMHRLEQEKAEIEFHTRAQSRITAVREGMRRAELGLKVVNQLFATIDTISREQFKLFCEPLFQQYPYIMAISFRRIISSAERPAYEASMRALYPDYAIKSRVNGKLVPAGVKDSYRVVEYVEPFKGNEED